VQPKVELPPDPQPEERAPDRRPSSSGKQAPVTQVIPGPVLPGLTDTGGTPFRPASVSTPVVKGDSRQVNKIALNQLVTGGYNTSGRPGHDGVMVVIEPRDAQNQLIDAPAQVSVVVLDPALTGQAARVARWDFSADEIAARFRKTVVATGIQLEMPWPAGPPVHNDLHVFVRYATSDGRKLQVDKPIKVALAGDPMNRGAAPTPATPAAPDEPAGPDLQATRPAEAWRRASAPAARADDAPPLRTAEAPRFISRRPAEPSPGSSDPTLQRPVWSPKRP